MANDRNNHRTKSLLFGKLWWDMSLLITAGGSLLSLVYTRESVRLLCLEACLQYLVHLPIWFLIALEFSRHKQALCKESIDLMFWGLHILLGNIASCPLGNQRLRAKLHWPWSLFLQPNALYTGEVGGFITWVAVRDHDSMLFKQLGEKEEEGSNAPFWEYVIPIYISF